MNSILNYRIILPPIAGGGMATIYKGINDELGKEVAIKMLNPSLAKEEKLRTRFKNEARVMLKLDHKNILKIENFYENNDILAFIMPLLEGHDLNHYIGNPNIDITKDQIIEIISQTLEALAYAHHKQVYHRDVKPSNIFVTENEGVKLLDFGIAKIKTEDLSMTGEYLGTPRYSSPEQIKDPKSVDGRADIYSVGVILYTLLQNIKVYEGLSTTVIQKKIVNEKLPKLEKYTEFQPIIDKATAKDINKRYQTAEEFIKDLNLIKQEATVFNDSRPKPPENTLMNNENTDFAQDNKKLKNKFLFSSKIKNFIISAVSIIIFGVLILFFIKVFNKPKYEHFRIVNNEILNSKNEPTGLKCDHFLNFVNGFSIIKVNELYNYIDKDGNLLMEKYTDDVQNFTEDRLAVVSQKGSYGFINTSGEFQIKPHYYNAFGFYNGKALVEDQQGWHVINKSDKIIYDIPNSYYINFNNNGQCGMILAYDKNSKKFGYINTKGKVKIDFKYSYASPFSNDIAIISKNGLYGYINKSGKEIVEPLLLYAEDFNDTKTAVVATKEGYGVISKSGKYIIEPQYQKITFFHNLYAVKNKFKYALMNPNGKFITEWVDNLSYNFASDSYIYTESNGILSQIINNKGKKIGDAYNEIIELPFNRFLVRKNFKYGIIDASGKVIVDPNKIIKHSNYYYAILDSVNNMWNLYNLKTDEKIAENLDDIKFLNSFALVQSNSKWQLIKNNEVINNFEILVDEKEDEYFVLQKDNKLYVVTGNLYTKTDLSSVDEVETQLGGIIVISNESQLEVWDNSGTKVFSNDSINNFAFDQYTYIAELKNGKYLFQSTNNLSFTYNDMEIIAPGLYQVENSDNKWNIIDENNNTVFNTWYDDIRPLTEASVAVKNNDSYALSDIFGNIISGFSFKDIYSFKKGISVIQNSVDDCSLIDHQGNILCPWYNDIPDPFYAPYFIVKNNEKYQVNDIWGNTILNPNSFELDFYDNVILKSEGSQAYSLISIDNKTIISNIAYIQSNEENTLFSVENKNDTYSLMYRDGSLIQNESYDGVVFLGNYFKVSNNDYYNLISYNGKKIFSTTYKNIHQLTNRKSIFVLDDSQLYDIFNDTKKNISKYYSEESSGINVLENSKYGLIDFEGNNIISPQYDYMKYFDNGIISVSRNSKKALIDGENNLIMGWYDNIEKINRYLYLITDKDKYALYNIFGKIISDLYDGLEYLNDNMYRVEKDDLYGIIMNNGKELLSPQYQDIKKLNSDKFLVEKDDKYYIVNSLEQTVSDIYDYAFTTSSNGNLIIARKSGMYSLLNSDGNLILDETYSNYGTDYSDIIYFTNNGSTYTLVSSSKGEIIGKNFSFGDFYWEYDSYNEKYYLNFSYMDYGETANLLLIPLNQMTPGVTATLSFYFETNTYYSSSNGFAVYVYNINTGYFDKIYTKSSIDEDYLTYKAITFTPKSSKPLIYIQGINKDSRYTLYLENIRLRQNKDISLRIYTN